MPASKRKTTGAHFTPTALAALVAERLVPMMDRMPGPLRILDPACGDGNLLSAIAVAMPERLRSRSTLIGIEQDSDSFKALRSRNSEFSSCNTDLINGDFLEFFDEGGLFGSSQEIPPVDVVIANPPYVRTQVLGAKRSQELAATFGLSGRVDLYQAFLVAMEKQLRPGGVLGVITSNRFLTTKGGTSTRRFLRSAFDLIEIVDLGDTKLFDAAVLPALVFAVKRHRTDSRVITTEPSFVRIYEVHEDCDTAIECFPSVIECLRKPRSGRYRVNGAVYNMSMGRLPIPHDDTRPWTMLSTDEAQWLAMINAGSESRIGHVAKVRVGIKTTADSVFIRRDWDCLPRETRPDDADLRPLLSQEDAAKWKALSASSPSRRVLYTHEVRRGRRQPILFEESSPTWQYLLTNRDRLEAREYVIGAGRRWYEIWVPQDPSAWLLPKIVFPDISPDARFFFDCSGAIVDGNCYWITTNNPYDEELLMFILGVANSQIISKYHDLAFQNKLYSQRRRHLTQYVAEYPLPARAHPSARRVPDLVRALVSGTLSRDAEEGLAAEIDALVADAFGAASPSYG